MVLQPKKTKYRKAQKGHMTGISKRGNFLEYGEFGIQALERGWITGKQIESMRVAISRYFQRKGRVWIRIFPDKPITKKPAEVRMGKGKGGLDQYVAVVKPGRILIEVGGNITEEQAQDALRRADAKLAIRTRMVRRVLEV